MSQHEIVIRIVIEQSQNLLTPIKKGIQSQVMPHLKLTGSAMPSSLLARHLDSYADYLAAKENDPVYIKKVHANCRKIFLDCGWVSPEDITDEGMIAWLAASKASRRAAKTRNHYRDALCGFCKWMQLKEIIKVNPIELVPKARVTDAVAKMALTKDHVDALIAAAKADGRKKDRWLVYMLAASTGLRKAELVGLKVHMFRGGEHPRFELPATITKSRKEQIVYIPDHLAGVVAEHVQGKGINDRVVDAVPSCKSFDRDRVDAGIPKVDNSGAKCSFHCLRHYYCNALANSETDEETRRKLMRHGTLAMTAHYTKPNAARLSKNINKTSFFTGGDGDDDPIHCIQRKDAPMQMVDAPFSGTEVQILSPRLGTQKQPNIDTPHENADGIHLHASSSGLDDGGAVSLNTERDAARTPNANRPSSTSHDRGSSGTLAESSRDQLASTNNPTRFTERDLSEAFLAGVRVGRGQPNGGA